MRVDGSQRLSMFETIRDFAGGRLEEDPRVSAGARQSHAEFFRDFASSRRDRLDGPDREAVLDELEAELGNLLLAWRHWVDVDDFERLDQLLDPLWVLHEARGWYSGAVELARDLLGLLSAAPSMPQHTQEKIALGTSLARGLLALRGYTDEVDEAYGRVLTLLGEAGGLPQLFPVLRNLATLHLYRAEFEEAIAVGRQLLELAEREHDVALQVEGHLVVGANLGSAGDVRTGLEHLEQAVALFDPQRHGPGRFRFGPSAGVVSRTTAALFRWVTGYPDRAVEHASSAFDIATELNHPYTLSYALFHIGLLDSWRREFELVYQRSSAVAEVAQKHGYEVWSALSLLLQGLAMASRGEAQAGLERSDRGMASYQGLKTPPVFWPILLSLRARTFAAAGRPEDGLDAIDQALEAFGERANVLLPELILIKGDLILGASGVSAAEAWFRTAIDVGREVEARMTQLRAATRLARLPTDRGKKAEAMDRLRGLYETFEEGFDAADLVDAREVLQGPAG
jgi:tetratricopeptide (TPR) repeat protein